ncbi:peptidoglycan DD-metalloendopeptidase family protein [Arthrobacter woluwensis]|uniref:peptidoglycan DD-metalloendopeptidase family protein n=1 Tax=Arthrobacter woluwensis TaxID=156980 RepID=UPI0038081225
MSEQRTNKKPLLLVAGAIAAATVLLLALVMGFFMMVLVMIAPKGGSQTAAGICLPGGITAVSSQGWTNPLEGLITSQWGLRPNLYGNFHTGTDIAGVPEGTPFYSASAGTVTAAYGDGQGDGGHGIIVDVGGGVEALYWHAQSGTTKVKVGDVVKPGQMLARVGMTGMATGVHLHFEIRINGASVDAVPFMKQRGVMLGSSKTGPAQPSGPTQLASQSSGGTLTATKTDGTVITFEPAQLANISRVVARGKAKHVGDKAILVAVVTLLQESAGGYMYANSNVPESLAIPHDRVGSDHDSVGLLQQRPEAGWGTPAELMNVEISADRFWGIDPASKNRGLTQISGWQDLSPGEAAQAVQISAFPDAYAAWVPVAEAVIAKSGGAMPVSCTGVGDYSAGQELPASGTDAQVRARVLAAAKKGLGTPYVWGGTSKATGWDCSGFVQWVYTQAGIAGVPRTEQWVFGKRTSDPQPGDLVVQIPDGTNHWSHVGIYAGGGKMYSALNPDSGTLLHPVDWNPDSAYFTMVGKG